MDMKDVQALIGALRTSPSPGGVTPRTGDRAGQFLADSPLESPIGTRRDGYRLYLREQQANGDRPVSYEEWISKQE